LAWIRALLIENACTLVGELMLAGGVSGMPSRVSLGHSPIDDSQIMHSRINNLSTVVILKDHDMIKYGLGNKWVYYTVNNNSNNNMKILTENNSIVMIDNNVLGELVGLIAYTKIDEEVGTSPKFINGVIVMSGHGSSTSKAINPCLGRLWG
jgi:hypothetical protein